MRNFLFVLLVLIVGAFVARADCPPATHPVDNGTITCNWYYIEDIGWTYECWNRTDCVPNDDGCFDDTPGLCAPPIWNGEVDIERRRLPFGVEARQHPKLA